jgi:hypothetical protein
MDSTETPSDGRKTDDSSASTVRKRCRASPTTENGASRSNGRRVPTSDHKRFESRRDSDDESEHETSSSSSSSSDSKKSIQSGQSVFGPKTAHAKAQLTNRLKNKSGRRSHGSIKTKRRFGK